MMKPALVTCLAVTAAAALSQAQVSQLEELKAGKVGKKEVELVIAHFNENQSWSDPYAAIRTTYCKGAPVPGCVPLENVGREGHTYLHHITENYENLAEWTVFSQAGAPTLGYHGHRLGGGHMQPGVTFDEYLLRKGDSDAFFVFTGAMHLPTAFHVLRESYMFPPDTAERQLEVGTQCPNTEVTSDHWARLDLPDWFKTMMSAKCGFPEGGLQAHLKKYWQDRISAELPEDGMVFFSQGARFAVSRERIHQRPREEYVALLNEVSRSSDPCANYMNEWLWYYIMGRPQAAPCDAQDINLEMPISEEVRFLSGSGTGTGSSTGTTSGASTGVSTGASTGSTTGSTTTGAANGNTTTGGANVTTTAAADKTASKALCHSSMGALLVALGLMVGRW